MARWPRASALAALLVAAPAGLCARAPAPVDPAALAQAELACRGIPDEIGEAERRIVALGWPRMRGGEGETMLGFERGGMMLMLAPPDDQGHPLSCGIMATLRRSVHEADLRAAVSAAFGRQPGPGEAAGSPVWELDGGQIAAVVTDGEGGVLFTFWYPRTTAR
jgi:hypothetical protein